MSYKKYIDRSFLGDSINRYAENMWIYKEISSENISEDFLKLREWRDPLNVFKYNLSVKERRAVDSERAVLMFGFSHGHKETMIKYLVSLSGDELKNLLDKSSAKIFVLEYFFNTTVIFRDDIYTDKLKLLEKRIFEHEQFL